MLLNNFKTLAKTSVRFLIAIVFCTLLLITSAFPAAAATSSLNKGEADLTDIQNETDEVAKSDPSDIGDIQKKGGINEVQGTADKDKMVRPETAQQNDVEQEIKNTLGKIGK